LKEGEETSDRAEEKNSPWGSNAISKREVRERDRGQELS